MGKSLRSSRKLALRRARSDAAQPTPWQVEAHARRLAALAKSLNSDPVPRDQPPPQPEHAQHDGDAQHDTDAGADMATDGGARGRSASRSGGGGGGCCGGGSAKIKNRKSRPVPILPRPATPPGSGSTTAAAAAGSGPAAAAAGQEGADCMELDGEESLSQKIRAKLHKVKAGGVQKKGPLRASKRQRQVGALHAFEQARKDAQGRGKRAKRNSRKSLDEIKYML